MAFLAFCLVPFDTCYNVWKFFIDTENGANEISSTEKVLRGLMVVAQLP